MPSLSFELQRTHSLVELLQVEKHYPTLDRMSSYSGQPTNESFNQSGASMDSFCNPESYNRINTLHKRVLRNETADFSRRALETTETLNSNNNSINQGNGTTNHAEGNEALFKRERKEENDLNDTHTSHDRHNSRYSFVHTFKFP